MNPNYNEQPNLSLPTPTLGEQLQPAEQHPPSQLVQEAGPTVGQIPQSSPPAASLPDPMPVQQPQATVSASAVPAVADDTDLIEKEWVEKAKVIVSGTRDDPFVQSREVSKFKAGYIQKRYDKTIKLPEA